MKIHYLALTDAVAAPGVAHNEYKEQHDECNDDCSTSNLPKVEYFEQSNVDTASRLPLRI